MSKPAKYTKRLVFTREYMAEGGLLVFRGTFDVVHQLNGAIKYMRFMDDGSIALTVDPDARITDETDESGQRRLILVCDE